MGSSGSISPSGTFDQIGNVREWTETLLPFGNGSMRQLRGGSYAEISFMNYFMGSYSGATASLTGSDANEAHRLGFRVAPIDVELTGKRFKAVTWPLISGLFVSNTEKPAR